MKTMERAAYGISRIIRMGLNLLFNHKYHIPALISLLVALIFVAVTSRYGQENSGLMFILTTDGEAAASLFSILYASIAVIMAISASTQRLARSNKKWFSGMLLILQKFKVPIGVSLMLVFICLFLPPIYANLPEGSLTDVFTTVMSFALVFLNTYLILATADVSFEMIAYIKTEFSSNADDGVQTFTRIEDQTDFIDEMYSCSKNTRDLVSALNTQLQKIPSVDDPDVMMRLSDSAASVSMVMSDLMRSSGLDRRELREVAERFVFDSADFTNIQRSITDLNENNGVLNRQISGFERSMTDLYEHSQLIKLIDDAFDSTGSDRTEASVKLHTQQADVISQIRTDLIRIRRTLDSLQKNFNTILKGDDE